MAAVHRRSVNLLRLVGYRSRRQRCRVHECYDSHSEKDANHHKKSQELKQQLSDPLRYVVDRLGRRVVDRILVRRDESELF